MRILFVAPYPLSRIRIRSYGFVSQLTKLHEVTVLSLCSSAREAMDVRSLQKEGINIIAIPDKFPLKVLRVLQALPTEKPLQVAFDASPALHDAIKYQLEANSFDLLHAEFIRVLGALPIDLPLPAVWDAVDCISQLYAYGAQFGTTPMVRMLGMLEARRARVYERAQLGRFQNVLVTAERDRQALLDIAKGETLAGRRSAKISVLPHGIDQNYFRPYTGKRQPETLIFSGKMSFHANVAGALYLVKDIMPLIWQKRPGVRLIIAGSKPTASIRRLAQDTRIEVTGYVSDLRPYIEQARVAVCPLPYAVGIQNKILEAMALRTPVVASSHAAAGLLATAGQDLFVMDDPGIFAAAVLRLLDDQEQWTRLSNNGSAYISNYHNWAQIMQQLTAIYTDAVHTVERNI